MEKMHCMIIYIIGFYQVFKDMPQWMTTSLGISMMYWWFWCQTIDEIYDTKLQLINQVNNTRNKIHVLYE